MTHTTNKAIKEAYNRYLNSTLYTLYDCYTAPSVRKQHAFGGCLTLFSNCHGRQPRIIGYNTMQFSFGFIGVIDGRQAFVYVTRDYDRYIYLDELEV